MRLKSLLSATLVFAQLLAFAPARAAQVTCVMPTSGTVSGLTLVNDINACTGSLLSLYSGASAPSSPTTFMLWMNTTLNVVQQYDGSNWNTIWAVDATNHLIMLPIGGGTATLTAATTTNLGSVPQSFITINGTTTIASFGSSAIVGTMHIVKFAGALTLTYNATNMILPGSQNINTQAGDIAFAVYLGGGNWQVVEYRPFSAAPQSGAYSFRGNNSGSSATPADVTIPGLANKATPTGSDLLWIADAAASNAWKNISISSILALLGTPQGVNAGATGLVVVNDAGTSNTLIDITADTAVLIASGQPKYLTGVSVQINTSTTGANGLDTGSRANSTWYNLYLISNGTTTAGLASLSATAPTLPSGYTYAMRVGAMLTDSSGNFMKSRQGGSSAQYSPQASGNTTVFPSILSASAAITLWTALPLGAFIPPTATAVSISIYSDIGAGGQFNMAANPNGAIATGALFYNNSDSLPVQIPMNVKLESQNLYFGASGSINSYRVKALGWTDKVNAN